MLLGAARLLKAREGELMEGGRGGVLLVFQPAEEGGGGAGEVIKAGVLGGVEAIFGLHGAVVCAWLGGGWGLRVSLVANHCTALLLLSHASTLSPTSTLPNSVARHCQ